MARDRGSRWHGSGGSRWHEGFHSLSTSACGQPSGSKDENFVSAAIVLDVEAVAGKRLTTRNVAQLESKALERRKACRLVVEVTKIEPPTCALSAGVFAHDAIKPALKTAREFEIFTIDGEHKRVVKDRPVEPVGHDEIDAIGAA